jgi:hypothetical protein
MTLTIDLIDHGALNLLQDMERLNLIRLYLQDENAEAPGKKDPHKSRVQSKIHTPLSDRLLGVLSSADISPREIRSERLSKYL